MTTIEIDNEMHLFTPFNRDITIAWSNENRGLFLPLVNGSKTFSTIWFRRNDQPDKQEYLQEDYNAVEEAFTKLENTPFEFLLCPDNSSSSGHRIYTSQNKTVVIILG